MYEMAEDRIERVVLAARPGLRVVDCQCLAGPDDRPYEEAHGSACIALVRSGTFRYRAANGVASLGPGALLLGNAGQSYTCSHEFDRGDRCLAFSFEPELLDSVASDVAPATCSGSFDHPSLPPTVRTAGLAALAIAACEDVLGGPSLEEIAYELAALALAGSCSDDLAHPRLHARDESRAMDAMRYMHENAAEPIALADVAARVGINPFHFLRTFRRVVGTTPHQYLVSVRLRRAALQLVTTDRPITDIAYDAGFGDLSNFIRTFQKAAGCSPRAFRARRRPTNGKIRQVLPTIDR
jgi:AraC-like DNA-binding protein